MVLEHIAGKDRGEEIERIDNILLRLLPPQNYSGHGGAEVQMIKAYERACAVMSQHVSKDPKRMTVLEFYEALDALKSQGRKQYQLNGQPD